jgi:hypothetical protein
MQEVADKQDEKRQLKTAAMPVSVVEGAGGVTLPSYADNRDVGLPDGPAAADMKAGYRVGDKSYTTTSDANAAVADYNAPDAIAARQAAVLSAAGKPMEAQQLKTAQVQGKAAQLTLDKGQHDFINQKLDERLGEVGTAQELAQHASTLTGKNVNVVVSEDGKKAQLAYTNEKGEQVKYGSEFDNTADGVSRAAVGYAKTMKPGEKIQALMHFKTYDETVRHNQETEDQGQQKIDEEGRHNVRTEGQGDKRIALEGQQVAISRGNLGVAQQGLGLRQQELGLHERTVKLGEDRFAADLKNDPERNLPEGTRIMTRQLGKTIDRLDNAIATSMANGNWDPKSESATDLLAQRRAAQIRLNEIAAPYTGGAAGGTQGGSSYDKVMGKGAAQPPAPGAGSGVKPNAGAASGPVPGAAQPVVAPAPVAPPKTLETILNPTGSPSLQPVLERRAPAIHAAATAVKKAMDDVAFAAKSQDPNKIQTATQRSQAAAAAFTNSMAGMDEKTQAQIREVLGV